MRHIRQLEADFADAIEYRLAGANPPQAGTDERMHITVTARCIGSLVNIDQTVPLTGLRRPLSTPGRGGSARSDTGCGETKVEMGRRVIEKIIRLAPNFESMIIRHTTFTLKHMASMFGARGDYYHGLIHPDQIGINRAGPKGYVDQPLPLSGRYLVVRVAAAGPASPSFPVTTLRKPF